MPQQVQYPAGYPPSPTLPAPPPGPGGTARAPHAHLAVDGSHRTVTPRPGAWRHPCTLPLPPPHSSSSSPDHPLWLLLARSMSQQTDTFAHTRPCRTAPAAQCSGGPSQGSWVPSQACGQGQHGSAMCLTPVWLLLARWRDEGGTATRLCPAVPAARRGPGPQSCPWLTSFTDAGVPGIGRSQDLPKGLKLDTQPWGLKIGHVDSWL